MKKQTRIVPRVFVEEIHHDIIHPLTGVCEGRFAIAVVVGGKKYCYAPSIKTPLWGRVRVPILGASKSAMEWFVENLFGKGADPMDEITEFPEDCSSDLSPEKDPVFTGFEISRPSSLRLN